MDFMYLLNLYQLVTKVKQHTFNNSYNIAQFKIIYEHVQETRLIYSNID